MPVSTSPSAPGDGAASEKPKQKRVKSARGYAAYAADIGVSERTIKRWVKRGKEVGDPFPLEDLAKSVDWWAKHQQNTPPAELVQAAGLAGTRDVVDQSPAKDPKGKGGAASAASAGSSAGASASGDADGDASAKPLMDRADMVAGTIEENLHRLHVIHSANLTLLEKAFGGSNEADIINRQRNAARSGEMLNAAQKAFDEYQRARGAVVSVAEVKRDLLRIHSAMAQSLLAIIEDLGVPRARCVAAVDAWFRMLRESDFFFDTQPDVAALSARPDVAGDVSTPA